MGSNTGNSNRSGAEARKAKLTAARERAAELGLDEALQSAPLAQVEKAIADAESGGSSDGGSGSSGDAGDTSTSSSSATTHSAPDIAARAIDVPPRRRDRPTKQKRAETRGTYRDASGRARIVGAGEPIPDGWTREADADLADRQRSAAGANVNPHVSGDLPEHKAQRGPRGR